MNLWYLFSTAELFKLKTFLSGGLWCSDIGSIIGFGEDAEGSGPQGLFVSCWHASEGDPTSRAWTIFGGDGDDTRCPSCARQGRDKSGDNLAICVADPRKYKCWAGCCKEEIRAALGHPIKARPGMST